MNKEKFSIWGIILKIQENIPCWNFEMEVEIWLSNLGKEN